MASLRTIICTTLIVLLFSAGNIAEAQQEAAVCSCSPMSFTFRLDFNRTCDNNLLIGKTRGIDRSFCRTDDVVEGNDTQSPPAVIELSSILILELDESLQVIKQYFRDSLGLVDGQALTYGSILATGTGGGTVAAIQMALTGATADGTEIQSQFILTYTNLCSIDVFREGDAISWLVVVSNYGADVLWQFTFHDKEFISSCSFLVIEQEDIVPAPANLCNSGALPNLATSASSSNDIPPALIDTPTDDHISNDNAGMDRSSEPMSLSLSMQMLRRLDFSEWLDESPELLKKEDMRKGANGGLDGRLRRRRFLVE